ncbi:GDP dissociation inhibitor-domain-containing protein [Dichotomopilus funicola]|uniref:Rab proteins geranylgeranyltransferase n=1 Tax=Dichotomopilus funicola TaxID=1934379 RepID=A0AAN6UWA8_9PEZI|nr:GDP dissociation inhibitor-domain-containing protein [Dichotomopilus funicola]
MESLSDTLWDVVISGTGLQQSLLALALSRSGKKILHIDPNEFYGGPEAAFSIQEADAWVARVSASSDGGIFKSASFARPEEAITGLSASRGYSLALAPQFIHARSALLSQLVSSRAYRQVEFLAVGSFYIFKPSQDAGQKPSLTRIPSTREEVFSTTAVSAKAKRSLMKFLKFVLDYENSPHLETWQPFAEAPLVDLLQSSFKMDTELQTYIVTLTLSLDGKIRTKDGLAVIRRHLSSMGVYGPGFAAIYPKWGGLSEIAQVSCRAGAVGGAVYMLGTGIEETEIVTGEGEGEGEIKLRLTSGDTVKTRKLVRVDERPSGRVGISRVTAVIGSPLKSLFEATMEGAPRPAVSVIAFPAGSISTVAGKASEYPVYLSAHSSETGECPVGQSVVYLTTLTNPNAQEILNNALVGFISATSDAEPSPVLYRLQYEQLAGSDKSHIEGSVFNLPAPSASLSFDDTTLESVREAWAMVMGDDAGGAEYMVFEDREGAAEEDDGYE